MQTTDGTDTSVSDRQQLQHFHTHTRKEKIRKAFLQHWLFSQQTAQYGPVQGGTCQTVFGHTWLPLLLFESSPKATDMDTVG